MPQKSCGVVVWTGPRTEPRFLLLRQVRHGHWEFPKGHVDPGEEETSTALRELAEETAIRDAQIDDRFREEIYYTVATRNGRDDKTVVYFLARAPSERFALSREHSEGGWYPFDAALGRLSFENYRQVLRAAAERLRTP